jgi:hypothetical protein
VAEQAGGPTMTPLENELRALGMSIAYPVPSADFAAGIQARLEREPRPSVPWWRRLFDLAGGGELPASRRPLRRALVLAIILLLAIVAIAAALGLGVPGIRIFFGPTATPSPSASVLQAPRASSTPGASQPLGASLGLGKFTPFEAVEGDVGFRPLLPAGLGPPEAAYVRDRRLMLVWPASSEQPQIDTSRVGLIVTELRGQVDTGYYAKVARSGTVVEAVKVGGHQGYWLTGEPHPFWYVDENGQVVDETRRVVAQSLIWADDELTYRLETSLPRDEAILLAETLR